MMTQAREECAKWIMVALTVEMIGRMMTLTVEAVGRMIAVM